MANGVEARRIAYSLAASQEGVIARRQLIGRGVSNDVVAHWLRSGYVFKVLPGVFSLGMPADRHQSFWMAGVLYAGDGSILAGESAAQAWGMGQSRTGIEVVRPRGVQRSVRGIAPHDESKFILRRGSLEPDDFAPKGPLPTMDPARTLIDLCTRVSDRRLRRYFIEAGRNGLLTAPCLNRMARRSLRFKNRRKLAALIGSWDPTTGRIRSILEGEFKLVCAEGSLPPPLTNYRIGPYEVDAVWLEARLVVELDGRKFHSDAEALVADSEKTRCLRSLGFRVLRFTWNDVVERPEWVVNQIRMALGSTY